MLRQKTKIGNQKSSLNIIKFSQQIVRFRFMDNTKLASFDWIQH